MEYESFNEAIKQAGEETATIINSQGNDRFQFSRDDLATHIKECNDLIHALCSSTDLPPSIVESMCTSLQQLSKQVKDKVLTAKAKWVSHVCSKIHDMQANPRVVWEYIGILTDGGTGYHKKRVTMAMKMTDGKIATHGKENMVVFGPHFVRVFNNHHPVDLTILDDIPQRPTLHDLDSHITFA